MQLGAYSVMYGLNNIQVVVLCLDNIQVVPVCLLRFQFQ